MVRILWWVSCWDLDTLHQNYIFSYAMETLPQRGHVLSHFGWTTLIINILEGSTLDEVSIWYIGISAKSNNATGM